MSWQDKTREQLIQELETLRQRVAELETEADLQKSEGEVSRLLHDQTLLSKAAIELMNFPLDGDIYQFIGEQLKELSGGRFVIVNTFDAEIEQIRVRAVAGWNQYRKTILDILGNHPIGMKLPLSEEAKVGLFTQELERVPSGLYGIALRQIPQSICQALEKVFNLGDFYSMGFVREGHLFGSIVLVLEQGANLKNPQAVKAFMGLAAVALQRRQIEAALLESEGRLREAERLAHLGHYEVDVSSGEVVWSDETFRIFGMRPDQAAPTVEAYRDLIYEEDQARVGEHLDRLVEGTEPFDLVYRIVTVDGDIRYVHSKGKAEEDPETGEVRVFGMLQDITARKRAEKELEHRRHLWDALMDNTPDLVYFKDNEHRMIRASRAYADVLGMDTEDLVGKTAAELWAREGEEILADECNVLAGKPLIRKERKVTTPEGESLWYLLTKIPIYTDGDIIGFFAIDKDITERKKAEEALRKSHERLLKILDGIDADIYVADMETYEILFLNRHMCASFGEDLVGKICWEVFRGGGGPCAHCTNDQLLDVEGDPSGVITWEGQNPVTGNWYINCDRAIKWMDARLVRLQIATDITERKRAEEALQESNLRLEEALADLKAAQETMLQQARLAAVGQLSAGIAHDFRNLLSSIILYAQLCQHEIGVPPKVARHIEIIIGESKKAADLV